MTPSPTLIAQNPNCSGLENCVQGSGSIFGTIASRYGAGGGGSVNIVTMITSVLNFLLGFLGLILVCLILYAGFLWMTAGGDAKQTEKAKDYMKNAVIGIAIILSAWVVSYFVINVITSFVLGRTPVL